MNDRVGLRLHGQPSAAEMGEAIAALGRLMDAITDDIAGKGAVRWELAAVRWECDGCGIERPAEHADWRHVDGDDFCPDCLAVGTREHTR